MKIEETIDWSWFAAIYLWDYNAPQKLSTIIKTETPPDEVCQILADIISEKRKPKKTSAAKFRYTAEKRLKALTQLYNDRARLDDMFKLENVDKLCDKADKERTTYSALLAQAKKDKQLAYETAAQELNISTRAIRTAYAQFKEMLKDLHIV